MSLCRVTFSFLKEWLFAGTVLLYKFLFIFGVLLMVLLALHAFSSFECLKKFVAFRFFTYTGCHRRNGPNFGRVFLMLNYTDITQNTYIQSWTVTEIMAREKCGHLAFPHSVRLQLSSALTVREECVTYFFDGTSSTQRDKIAFHYCRYV